ncbi:NAD(P)/FAD-dependent oxidoreductase [Streptomyces radicis]|uniref:NAD(P)/FAD-dependent oxidoreductase n=1 Tax=Streptomyces radicis TaxID=1750517 RepID=A0A3A9VQL6_9ACTN|nr:NAD(P)/FAD-dependent oxidoreductase [Streptomyces radicis]RKN03069.1 NAD(P)/FAD-dependent oxidoreductase [Streptomyces radicis]RKN26371.1 NAD(P)/FAD-dependent oxidoreductase [Streptomyces radicis]
MTKQPAHIVVAGGGHVGLFTALRLQRGLRRELRRGDVRITVISPDPYMTYQPFLPEAAAGSLSPRHVVVPLRRVLSRCRFLPGEVTAVDPGRRTISVRTPADQETGGEPLRVDYDELVLAPGSISRTLPVPGLADHGIGFKTIEEAIGLRNHVLEQLDIASSTRDSAVRDAALTFVFVGGGYAGVEALAELEDMGRYACRYYHNIRPEEQKWILVEATDRILPEVGEQMGTYALRELRGRNVDVRLGTRLESCDDRVATLSDGSRHPTRTLVWTAGVKAHPVLASCDVPLDGRGRVRCRPDLRVEDREHLWSAGDAAAVPDLTREDTGGPRALCAPTAQHATRQARRLADNIAAALRGEPLTDYRHRDLGSVASLGLHKGVARVRRRRVKGPAAWLMHRAYHLGRVPTAHRKARILAEWALAGLFRREIVSLGSLEHPRAEFELAAGTGRHPEGT